MNSKEFILCFLCGYSESYRRLRRSLYGGMPSRAEELAEQAQMKKNTVQVTLYRLKQQGLIENRNGLWQATRRGVAWIRKRRDAGTFSSRRQSHSAQQDRILREQKRMIVAFDIPELRKKDREWLRTELIILGFKKLQASVWVGPAPLPQSFFTGIRVLELLPYVKFFRVREEDIV